MSEKKRFRLGPAVVNICAMRPELAESVINICHSSIRCAGRPLPRRFVCAKRALTLHAARRDKVTEQEAAIDVKAKLKAKYPDGLWQVRAGTGICRLCAL